MRELEIIISARSSADFEVRYSQSVFLTNRINRKMKESLFPKKDQATSRNCPCRMGDALLSPKKKLPDNNNIIPTKRLAFREFYIRQRNFQPKTPQGRRKLYFNI